MVLHTDQPHPHVHLVVKAASEQGRRLNIRKATLLQWREEFARQLRAQGIEANATARAVRGAVAPAKSDAICWAMRDGRSTFMERRVESVALNLAAGTISVEPGKARIIETRKRALQGWFEVRDQLRRQGHDNLAGDVERFLKEIPRPQTEREWIARSFMANVQDQPHRPPLERPR